MNDAITKKESKGRAVLKDQIPMRTYVLTDKTPSDLQFSRHMLRFVGLKPFQAEADLLWGVQGTTSLNSTDLYASREADHRGSRVFQLDLFYMIRGLPPSGTSVTEEFAKQAGYLHYSRINSGFRKTLRERMLTWQEEAGDPEIEELRLMDFEELIKNRPMLIHKLMAADAYIKAVIHPVFLPGGVTVRIATVRNIPENIVKVHTRFHEEIKTIV